MEKNDAVHGDKKRVILEIKNLVKDFEGKQVLKNISFKILSNTFVSLLGPSGCGKTTTLRILGGFELPTSGTILINDKNLLKMPANKRPINTVFQNYALFPHLNVYENIAFGLRTKKKNKNISEPEMKKFQGNIARAKAGLEKAKRTNYTSKKTGELVEKIYTTKQLIHSNNTKENKLLLDGLNREYKNELNKNKETRNIAIQKAKDELYFAKDLFIGQQVKKWLSILNLNSHKWMKPDELSGGQQQRVAIARSLINEPDILLLDEPLSALDAKLRKEMQAELKRMQRETGITFIYITHDQSEAMTMSDYIIVMSEGRIQQQGTPHLIYDEPASKWVAKFVGESNIFEGYIKDDKIVLDKKSFEYESTKKIVGDNVIIDVMIRPEDVDIVNVRKGYFSGVIIDRTFQGQDWTYTIETKEGRKWMVSTPNPHYINETVGLRFDPIDLHPMKRSIAADKKEIILNKLV